MATRSAVVSFAGTVYTARHATCPSSGAETTPVSTVPPDVTRVTSTSAAAHTVAPPDASAVCTYIYVSTPTIAPVYPGPDTVVSSAEAAPGGKVR
jgi:hypothetical protein